MKISSSIAFLLASSGVTTTSVSAFGTTLFPETATTAPSTYPTKGEQSQEIELPNFDDLFDRIQQVSPLSRVVLQDEENRSKGFGAIDPTWSKSLPWKKVEANSKRLVHQIERIDNFQGLNAPLLRLRASMEGPCEGEGFANFIMDLDYRKKWDAQIDNVYEAYTIADLDAVNIAMGFNYGDCSRLGVGHCITKPNLGIDAREQLTICGVNEFEDGSCLIWGTEMEDRHNHLLPPTKRVTRAKSHLFSTALVPTGPNSFDLEYVIQLEIGGKIPTWMTTPIVIENCKKCLAVSQKFFLNENGDLDKYLAEKATRMNVMAGPSLLMTP